MKVRATGLVLLCFVLVACDGRPPLEIEGTPPGSEGAMTASRSGEEAGHGHGETAHPAGPRNTKRKRPPMMKAPDPESLDGHRFPLVKESRDAVELKRVLKQLPADLRPVFEDGFRRAYTAVWEKKDFAGAQAAFLRIIKEKPEFPPVHKAMAYVFFNGGRADLAKKAYERAIQLDPEYGEAHYALAFLLVMSDREAGKKHFEKAMELGVEDDRNLGERFFGE